MNVHAFAWKYLFLIFVTLQETSSLAASTIESKTGISDTDRTSFGKQIRSLLMEVIKVRKQAVAIGNRKYVGALNSYVKSLAKLMKVVKESVFNKEKVGNILRAIQKRVTLITAELAGRVTTVTSETAAIEAVRKVCDYFLGGSFLFIFFFFLPRVGNINDETPLISVAEMLRGPFTHFQIRVL